MHAFILAGGFATRLWPLTEKRAKPLLPLAGKPILTHLVEWIPEEISVTVSTNEAFAEGFTTWREEISRPGLELVIEKSRQDAQKKGALGAVAEWVDLANVQEDVLLLTGDNYLGFPLTRFLSVYQAGVPLLAAFDLRDAERAKSFGTVLVDPANPARITGFEEKPPHPKTTLVSTGCSVLPKEILPVLVEFSAAHPDNVGGLFEELVRRGIPVSCFTFTEPWLDIGSFHSYLEAHRLLVGERLLADSTSSVEGTACAGSVAVGKHCQIRRSDLTDCIIFQNCVIEDCTLRNCIVDDGCILRGVDLSHKMLRAGTVLKLAAAA